MDKNIELICSHCGKNFLRALRHYKFELKRSGENYSPVCSLSCRSKLMNKHEEVCCEHCNKIFMKARKDINKTKHNFCSQSCSASFSNLKRKTTNDIKTINCKYCDVTFNVTKHSTKLVCDSCKYERNKNIALSHIVQSNCISCQKTIESKRYTKRKYCDECLTNFRKEFGKIIGLLSAQKQVRRSKNEIYFAKLCQEKYSSVTTNEAFFKSKYGNWDADVIIHEYKIAILWNGIWHYQQVNKKHCLKQVQNRDKIKIDIIKDNGYIPYIIKDEGKYSIKFVEEQFDILLDYIQKIKDKLMLSEKAEDLLKELLKGYVDSNRGDVGWEFSEEDEIIAKELLDKWYLKHKGQYRYSLTEKSKELT